MKPTNELRFVERVIPAPEYGDGVGKTVLILQQQWAVFNQNVIVKHEWRDVPFVKEPTP